MRVLIKLRLITLGCLPLLTQACKPGHQSAPAQLQSESARAPVAERALSDFEIVINAYGVTVPTPLHALSTLLISNFGQNRVGIPVGRSVQRELSAAGISEWNIDGQFYCLLPGRLPMRGTKRVTGADSQRLFG